MSCINGLDGSAVRRAIMGCPLHGPVWCSCQWPRPSTEEEIKIRQARVARDFFQDVTAGAVLRDYAYRHDVPKFWSGWRYEIGHKCDNGEIKAGQGSCGVCY